MVPSENATSVLEVVKFADIARIFSLAHPHGFFGFVRFTIGHKYTNAIE